MSQSKILPPKPTRHLARLTFIAFLFTFIASRTLVILITAGRIPDLFLHMGGTHVHHLNYGIFLLATVAGVLLFARLNDKQRSVCALAYGFGMALTFDEFGMWLHLGGSYWQRASFDAMVVLAAAFGLIVYARAIKTFEARHVRAFIALAIALLAFGVVLYDASRHIGNLEGPRLRELELASSP